MGPMCSYWHSSRYHPRSAKNSKGPKMDAPPGGGGVGGWVRARAMGQGHGGPWARVARAHMFLHGDARAWTSSNIPRSNPHVLWVWAWARGHGEGLGQGCSCTYVFARGCSCMDIFKHPSFKPTCALGVGLGQGPWGGPGPGPWGRARDGVVGGGGGAIHFGAFRIS